MDHRPTTLERAFALADSALSPKEIGIQLAREGYDEGQISSPTVVRQLLARGRKARSNAHWSVG